jgi:integrase
MSCFTSIYAAELNEYIAIREKVLAPGSIALDRRVLMDFDEYIGAINVVGRSICEDIVSGWVLRLRAKNHSRTVSDKVCCLRGFLEYLRYSGVSVFMPRRPKHSEDYTPYIFSDAEMAKIFGAADEAAPKTRWSAACEFELPMLLRLLYGCGLRLGETLPLVVGDVDFKRGTLLIRKAKNAKQRVVPMHESLSLILLGYCAAMGIIEEADAFLFPGANPGLPLSAQSALHRFKSILKETGIFIPPRKPGQRGQCLHCLRHLFAVKSFSQAEESGRPVNDSVPFLSVYLGHYDMDGTEKYLKFSSDIFPGHTELFAAYSAGVFTVLGGAE